MNQKEKYQKFALCREMEETPGVIRNFKVPHLDLFTEQATNYGSILLTGEGSSRIFPAKRAISQALKNGETTRFFTEGATQAMQYDLRHTGVFGSSNSGKTRELIRLFHKLSEEEHKALFGITAHKNTALESFCRESYILSCGEEKAVAATKSVAEQALFYDALRAGLSGTELSGLEDAAQSVEKALHLEIDPEIIRLIASSGMIYFAGLNNGVAEELTLKTNEITRKKSDFLEGTYAAHGIEEVMNPQDVLIVVDPIEEEEEKFLECLTKGAGVRIVSIANRKTSFAHSIVIPDAGEFQNYIELAAGWNLLVETGLELGIDLDTPVRARKVGNEYRAV